MGWTGLAIRRRISSSHEIGDSMGSLIEAISSFISKAVTLTVAGSIVALVAGEVRLAALKKASQGSSKLSGFTQRMTNTKLNLSR